MYDGERFSKGTSSNIKWKATDSRISRETVEVAKTEKSAVHFL